MSPLCEHPIQTPIAFIPLFHERVWGGRRLAERYGKVLPEDALIGESWELVDRPEAQSFVRDGPRAGATLHELWIGPEREAVFGSRAARGGGRFPLLVKLLDARDTLSVQVHPPPSVAAELDGEPKTEVWFVAHAEPGAHLLVGLRDGVSREAFETALRADKDVSAMLHRVDVVAGDAIFIPSGRVHAIGSGCLIVEVQQNSDTTYRVFDFHRPGLDGSPRRLDIEASLRSIDWRDVEPSLVEPAGDGEIRVSCGFFDVALWTLDAPRPAADPGECAMLLLVEGEAHLGDRPMVPGELLLAPAAASLALRPGRAAPARVLRIALAPG